jgi:uncharacterized protein YegJ (DUF2314 family)
LATTPAFEVLASCFLFTGDFRMTRWLRLVAVALLFSLAYGSSAMSQEPPPVGVPTDDPEMAEAIYIARESLPSFWARLQNPASDEEGFALKVAFPNVENSFEHIWLIEIERSGSRISGVVNNTPATVPTLRDGSRLEIDPTRITDWLYLKSRKMVGNYTLRALLKRLPPEDAAYARQLLAP